MDDQVLIDKGGNYLKYLVRWKGQPINDATQIPHKELQQLDPNFPQQYDVRLHDPYPKGSSPLHLGSIDEDTYSGSWTRARDHGDTRDATTQLLIQSIYFSPSRPCMVTYDFLHILIHILFDSTTCRPCYVLSHSQVWSNLVLLVYIQAMLWLCSLVFSFKF